jgi:hypothetical protein
MSIGMIKLIGLAVVIVATTSLMVGVSAIIEQDVKAQNMTGNMTNSTGSGSISSFSEAESPQPCSGC